MVGVCSIAVDYADLAIVDLAKADTPQGREELTALVREAMTTQGFFYVINHGYTQAQVCVTTTRLHAEV